MEKVGSIDALATELGIEHEPAGCEASASKDLVYRQTQLIDRVWELVGIPTVLRIASIGIDRTEDAVVDCVRNLMFERVPRERRVVRLDIDLELIEEVVALEEPVHRCAVVVVLVLGGFLRLGLDEQRPGETNRVFVLSDHGQKASELVGLLHHSRIEQCFVTFAASPKGVVVAVEPVGRIEHVAHLGSGIGKDIGVWVCGSARRISRMREQVCRAPQKFDAGLVHLLGSPFDHHIEVGFGLGQGVTRWCHIDVVEGKEFDSEFRDELERGVLLHSGGIHGVHASVKPWTVEGASAKDV